MTPPLRSVPRTHTHHAWPLRGDARAAGQARAVVRDVLTGLELSAELVEDAVLMASEVVTNAYLYGQAPYELVLYTDREEIVCMVVDRGSPQPVARIAEAEAERGRGLVLVAELSDGFWGCHPQLYVTSPGIVGKATWFALPCRRSGTATGARHGGVTAESGPSSAA
jgi:anti-sigma regulatory factor (Ser/Thr protein kinase)